MDNFLRNKSKMSFKKQIKKVKLMAIFLISKKKSHFFDKRMANFDALNEQIKW